MEIKANSTLGYINNTTAGRSRGVVLPICLAVLKLHLAICDFGLLGTRKILTLE